MQATESVETKDIADSGGDLVSMNEKELETLIQDEEVVILFLAKLMRLLQTSKENTGSDRLLISDIKSHLKNKDCLDIVQRIKVHVDSHYKNSVSQVEPGYSLFKYLNDPLTVERIQFRPENANKLHQLLCMHRSPLSLNEAKSDRHNVITFCMPFLVLSEVIKEHGARCDSFQEVRFTAAVKLFVDCNLPNDRFHGKNLILAAPCIEIVGKEFSLDVSGHNSTKHANKPVKAASSGKDGAHGQDAEHGGAGESGGNVFVKCMHMINPAGLHIVSNGGNGGNGAGGGDGGDGGNGDDGTEGGHGRYKGVCNYSYVFRGSAGKPGGKGGNGGGRSLGGEAGLAGRVDVEIGTESDDQAGHLTDEVRIRNEAGQPGSAGDKMGKGGAGGRPGKDGIDVLHYKASAVFAMEIIKGKFRDNVRDQFYAGDLLLAQSNYAYDDYEGFDRGCRTYSHMGDCVWAVEKPVPVMSEAQFAAAQITKQDREQLQNQGADATVVSQRPREKAQRKVDCNKATSMAEFFAQVDGEMKKSNLFVSAEMQQFYALLTKSAIRADDQVDGVFLSSATTAVERAAALEQKAIARERQVELETQAEQHCDVQIAHRVGAAEDECAAADGGVSTALGGRAGSAPKYRDLQAYYEARTALTVYMEDTQKEWAGRALPVLEGEDPLLHNTVGDLILHRFVELEERSAYFDDIIFEPFLYVDFLMNSISAHCECSATGEKQITPEQFRIFAEEPVYCWAQELCAIEDCENIVRKMMQQLAPPDSPEAQRDWSKVYVSQQWLAEQGFSLNEINGLFSCLENVHFNGLVASPRAADGDVASPRTERSLYEVNLPNVAAAFADEGTCLTLEQCSSELRGKGQLSGDFLACLQKLSSITDTIRKLHSNNGLLLVLHALGRYFDVEQAGMLEPLQFYMDLLQLLGELSKYNCDDVVKVLLRSSVSRWQHQLKALLLKMQLLELLEIAEDDKSAASSLADREEGTSSGVKADEGAVQENQLFAVHFCRDRFKATPWKAVAQDVDLWISARTKLACVCSVAGLCLGIVASVSNESLAGSFDTSVVLISVILLGKFLEVCAEKQITTTSRQLAKRQAHTARRLISSADSATTEAAAPQLKNSDREIDAALLLRGDIVCLRAGDTVPADGQLLPGARISVNEAMMTRERIHVTKNECDCVFGGTVVIEGSALMRVTASGKDSTLGRILRTVHQEQARTFKTPMMELVNSSVRSIVPMIAFTALLTFLCWYWSMSHCWAGEVSYLWHTVAANLHMFAFVNSLVSAFFSTCSLLPSAAMGDTLIGLLCKGSFLQPGSKVKIAVIGKAGSSEVNGTEAAVFLQGEPEQRISPQAREEAVVKVVCLLDQVQTQFGNVAAKIVQAKILRSCCSDGVLIAVSSVLESLLDSPSGLASDILAIMTDAKVPLSRWADRHQTLLACYPGSVTGEELSLDELIEALRSNPKNTDLLGVNWDHMRTDVATIHQRCKELSKLTSEGLSAEFKANKAELELCLKETSYSTLRDSALFCDAIAMVCTAIHLCQACLPRNHQLLCVLLALQTGKLKGTLFEVSTGQGKTMIVLMLALLRAMSGRAVDAITSSRVLAKRDAEKARPVCGVFGLGVADNCSDEVAQRTASYQNAIVYGEAGDFQRDFLLDTFQGMSVRGERPYEAAIIDEVDSMFLDKGDSMLYLSQAIPGLELLEGLFVYIWAAVNGPDIGSDSASDIKSVKDFIENTMRDGDIVIPVYLVEFVKSKMETWIESAIFAKGALNENDMYRLSEARHGVVVMDKNTGAQMKSTHLSDGVQQFLQLKHLQRFKPETLKSVFVSNIKFFKLYAHLSGFSGTLGSDVECNLLSQVYGIAVTFVPTFKVCQRVQLPPVVCTSTKARNAEVVNISRSLVDKGRPVLVINNSIAEVLALAQEFKEHGVPCKSYTTDDDHFQEDLRAGDIILSTNLAGRGTDFKISKQMDEAGGLHVILTFVPANLRIERQAFGRAARQGERGSGQYIISAATTATAAPNEPARSVLDKLVFDRDCLERTRLYRLSAYRLLQIELEEDLLDKFHEQVVSKIPNGADSEERCLNRTLRKSVRERFAFWLDTQKAAILEVKMPGHSSKVRASFGKLVAECNSTESETTERFQNFHYLLQLGKYYVTHSMPVKAKEIFNMAREKEPYFCELADYFLSAAIINESEKNYEQAVAALVRARCRLNKRMEHMSNFSSVMEQVRRSTMDGGKGLQSDLYAKQIECKLSVLRALVSSIDVAIGNLDNDLAAVGSTLLSEDARLDVLDKLRESKLFLPLGVISAFEYTEAMIVDAIRTAEYSPAAKASIAAIVLQSEGVLTPASFAEVIGHSDDLLGLLCEKGILQLEPTKCSALDASSLFQPLTERLAAAHGIVGGEIVFCRQDNSRWVIHPVSSEKVGDGLSDLQYIMSRPEPADPAKVMTRKLTFVSDAHGGAQCLKFEPIEDPLNTVSLTSFVLLKSGKADLHNWRGMRISVACKESLTLHHGVCLGASTEYADGKDKFRLQVRWSECPNVSRPKDVTWVVSSEGALADLCMGAVALQTLDFCPQNSYIVLRSGVAASKIEELFKEPLFCSKYPSIDGLRECLLQHSKPAVGSTDRALHAAGDSTSTDRAVHAIHNSTSTDSAASAATSLPLFTFTKDQIQVYPRDQACEKLVEQLRSYLILQPTTLDPLYGGDAKLAERRAVVLGCLGDVPEKIRDKVFEDVMVSVNDAFSRNRGTLQESYTAGSDGTLVCSTVPLAMEIQSYFTLSLHDELLDMAHLGMDSVVKFKNQPAWWGPAVVILLGVAQIFAGVVITFLGNPALGAAFISEGVGDISFAIEGYLTGSFSFAAYGQHKLISVGLTLLTFGVGAFAAKGVQVASVKFGEILWKAVVWKMGKKLLEAGVNAFSGLAVDNIMSDFSTTVICKFSEDYGETTKPAFAKITELLVSLLHKTGSEAAVTTFMRKVSADLFEINVLWGERFEKFKKAISAVTAGLNRAAKIRSTHFAAFGSLQLAAQVLKWLVKAAKIAYNVERTRSEILDFLSAVQKAVEDEIEIVDAHRASSASTPSTTSTTSTTSTSTTTSTTSTTSTTTTTSTTSTTSTTTTTTISVPPVLQVELPPLKGV